MRVGQATGSVPFAGYKLHNKTGRSISVAIGSNLRFRNVRPLVRGVLLRRCGVQG